MPRYHYISNGLCGTRQFYLPLTLKNNLHSPKEDYYVEVTHGNIKALISPETSTFLSGKDYQAQPNFQNGRSK